MWKIAGRLIALACLCSPSLAILQITFPASKLGGNNLEWLGIDAEIRFDSTLMGRLPANFQFVGGAPLTVAFGWAYDDEDPFDTGLTIAEWVNDQGTYVTAGNIRLALQCPLGAAQYYERSNWYPPLCCGPYFPIFLPNSMPDFAPCGGCQSLAPDGHDFGVVTESGPHSTTFTIRNEGEACEPISGLVFPSHPDDLFVVTPTSYTLLAGQAQEFLVTYLADNRGEVVRDIYTTHGRFTCRVEDQASSGLDTPGLPSSFGLRAFPNPFNPSTTLAFHLPMAGELRVDLFDATGAHVRNVAREWRGAGEHRMALDLGDLPTGIYLCMLQAGDRRQVVKLLLVR